MMGDLNSFMAWLQGLPTTEKKRVCEFLTVLSESNKQGIAIGLFVNCNTDGSITFDTNKVSYGSVKKLLFDPE